MRGLQEHTAPVQDDDPLAFCSREPLSCPQVRPIREQRRSKPGSAPASSFRTSNQCCSSLRRAREVRTRTGPWRPSRKERSRGQAGPNRAASGATRNKRAPASSARA
eukprot:scaffold2979_cov243-Pinguiococcus_pyrenoidosus.AAC.4